MITVKASHSFPAGQILEINQGDLTEETLDAMVNAANTYLSHGGGVAGAIVRKGGEVIQEESNAWVKKHGLVTHAEPAYTGPGRLCCRYVIHAVGPVWGEGEEDRKLAEAIRGSLRLAERLGLKSVALPAISTGIFGFPKARAAQVIFEAIRDYFQENPQAKVNLVRLTIIDEPTVNTFLEVFETWAGRLEAHKNPGKDIGSA
jgi:O-acetyl-ADP-ribose deacetylase (regulator of RNase III)